MAETDPIARPPSLRVLSLGAGVQSSVLFLKACRGELPRIDAAIFSDTGWEPQAVYEHLEWLEEQGRAAGIPVRRVQAGNIKTDALVSQVGGLKSDGHRWASMPFYTMQDGALREGQIRRQCTREYKLDPIRKELRRMLGLEPRQQVPRLTRVEQWIGISVDELRRVRMSRERWVVLVYPLVFWLRMRRSDCQAWFERTFPGRALPRSACLGCPFKSNAEWRRLRESPDEWREVVEFDRAIRTMPGMRGKAFLHRSCQPLDQAPIDDGAAGQSDLWNQECLGMCGV